MFNSSNKKTPKVVAFGTLKGGTGKTTVAFNIGGILAEKYKVLFIDVDPQANLTDNLGINTAWQDAVTVRHIFNNPTTVDASSCIILEPIPDLPNVDLIPSHIRLTATEMRLVTSPGRERILQRWMKRNEAALSVYDYILIDTNPSMGVVNQNAFLVADSIILVSDVSRKAIQGAQLFTYLWGEVTDAMQIEDKVRAIILNNYDRRTRLSKNLFEYYKEDEEFGSILINTVVPNRVEIKTTELKYSTINMLAPDSDSCEAFRNIVSELFERKVF